MSMKMDVLDTHILSTGVQSQQGDKASDLEEEVKQDGHSSIK